MEKIYESTDSVKVIQFFQSLRILRSISKCQKCLRERKFYVHTKNSDIHHWFCTKCSGKKSVREGSFFSSLKLSLLAINQLIYHWSRGIHINLALNLTGYHFSSMFSRV